MMYADILETGRLEGDGSTLAAAARSCSGWSRRTGRGPAQATAVADEDAPGAAVLEDVADPLRRDTRRRAARTAPRASSTAEDRDHGVDRTLHEHGHRSPGRTPIRTSCDAAGLTLRMQLAECELARALPDGNPVRRPGSPASRTSAVTGAVRKRLGARCRCNRTSSASRSSAVRMSTSEIDPIRIFEQRGQQTPKWRDRARGGSRGKALLVEIEVQRVAARGVVVVHLQAERVHAVALARMNPLRRDRNAGELADACRKEVEHDVAGGRARQASSCRAARRRRNCCVSAEALRARARGTSRAGVHVHGERKHLDEEPERALRGGRGTIVRGRVEPDVAACRSRGAARPPSGVANSANSEISGVRLRKPGSAAHRRSAGATWPRPARA